MNSKVNMDTINNQDLGFYYEIISEKLQNAKLKIIENIVIVFSDDKKPDRETFHQDEKFMKYCTPFRSIIDEDEREGFENLHNERQQVMQEIRTRQWELLKEIHIEHPSMLVHMLMDQTRGEHFPLFDDVVQLTKLLLKNEADQRPKDKELLAPERFVKLCERTGNSIIDVMAYNI